MATGMKVWLGTVLGLCLVVTVWAVPPSRLSDRLRVVPPEEARARAAAAELQLAHGVLVAHRWSDSLSALVVETAVDGVALAHPPSDLVTTEGFDEWRNLVEAWLDSRPARDPDMKVGYFFQPDLHGTLEGVLSPGFGNRSQVYVGTRDGTSYCFMVQPIRYPITNAGLRSARTPELCSWHAEYGVPGAEIAAWLEYGGFDLAMPGPYEELADFLRSRRPPVVPFGLLRPIDEPIAVAACMAGRDEACERAVVDPEVLTYRHGNRELIEQSAISHRSAIGSSDFENLSRFLLAELEATFGPEAFARFWHSDRAVPDAFEAAFGVEMGAWVGDWVQRRLSTYRAGPAPRIASVGWSMFTVLLLSAFATFLQARRRVT